MPAGTTQPVTMTFTLVVALFYALPAIVLGVVTRQMWGYERIRRPRSQAFRLMPVVTGMLTLHFGLLAAMTLAPLGMHADPWVDVTANCNLVREVSWLVIIALLRHLVVLLPMPERHPRRMWIALNYGLVAVVATADVVLRLATGSDAERRAGHHVFELGFATMVGLVLWDLWRLARPGAWGPEHAGEIRRPDLILIVAGCVATVLVVPLFAVAGHLTLGLVLYEVMAGLAIASPFALRMLGVVVRRSLMALALGAGAVALLAGYRWALGEVDGAWIPLLDGGIVLAIATVFVPVRRWLARATERLVLRRGVHAEAELLAYLRTLSPELGVAACCRRALTELVRLWHVPGAAIILRDGEVFVHGDFDVDPLRAAWPHGDAADTLPPRGFGSAELRELPLALREALTVAGVGLGTFAILSPRRRWGHLFLRTGLLYGAVDEHEVVALGAFTDQLALLLDGADLLARTVAVERTLAHAEKLAAIGELAARVAHEIRNPLTAAHSLAQQLVREPAVPFRDELGIILDELERVERQVASLLRFARREEFQFADVDLGNLVRSVVASVEPRFAAAAIRLELDARPGIVTRADGEKLRQVVINLLENAMDAVRDRPGERRVVVALDDAEGVARMRVRDTGPGVPAEVRDRLFEPFFSLKPTGTGLGLAIAKRTVDAHGGRIAVAEDQSAGLCIEIAMPLRGSA